VTIKELKAVCDVLVEALGSDPDEPEGFVDFQHDIIYLPWGEETGEVADKLTALGCHYESEVSSWAHF
jgi:hypothetical protein